MMTPRNWRLWTCAFVLLCFAAACSAQFPFPGLGGVPHFRLSNPVFDPTMSGFGQGKPFGFPFPDGKECEEDGHKFCRGMMRICHQEEECALHCLTDHMPQLSEKCLKAHPCAGDAQKFCASISGGEGKLIHCLKDNLSRITPPCRDHHKCLSDAHVECPHPSGPRPLNPFKLIRHMMGATDDDGTESPLLPHGRRHQLEMKEKELDNERRALQRREDQEVARERQEINMERSEINRERSDLMRQQTDFTHEKSEWEQQHPGAASAVPSRVSPELAMKRWATPRDRTPSLHDPPLIPQLAENSATAAVAHCAAVILSVLLVLAIQ